MKPDIETVLDECLDRTRKGESVEACAAEYPEFEGELLGLLMAAAAARQAPAPRARPEAYAAGRQRMLAAFASLGVTQPVKNRGIGPGLPLSHAALPQAARNNTARARAFLPGKEMHGLSLAFRSAMIFVVVCVLVGVIAVNVSASSLPGDPLYAVKRSWEQVQLDLTSNPSTRQVLEDRLLNTRKDEVDRLILLGRQESIDISGRVTAVALDRFSLGGLEIFTNAGTQVYGVLQVGVEAQVKARVVGNSLLADQIRVERDSEAPDDGDWQPTMASTEVEHPSRTSTPESPEAEDTTETPEPTEVEDSKETPEPTEVEHAKETPEPTEVEDREETPKPTDEEHDSKTSEPTEAHDDDETPEHDESSQNPEPSETPKPDSHLAP